MMVSPTRAGPGRRPAAAAIDTLALALERSLGAGRVLRDASSIDAASRDESGFGAFPPDLVVDPRDAGEVSTILRAATDAGVPVTPRGGGTGRVGGALAVMGGLVLRLGSMDRIVRIDRGSRLARVEPGVILAPLHAAVEAEGLFYPPDPSSLESCSIGGNVACNAGGPRALKYGSTSNHVLGVEVVLPTGEILETGRNTPKGGAGYELHKLLVGSEGTLGVITAITLRLVSRPTRVETAMVTFAEARDACRAAAAILAGGLLPRSMELLDRVSLDAARTRMARPPPPGAGACLIVELDGFDDDPLLERMAQVGDACTSCGSRDVLVAQDEHQRREVWAARRELSPALRQAHPCKVSEDVVIPLGRLPEAMDRVLEIGARHGVTLAAFGHAGDGNIHVNVLFDEEHRPGADAACLDVLRMAVALGGTVAGEHGTGLQKVEALALEQSSELLAFQRRLKRVFDPAGIMNPGKVL